MKLELIEDGKHLDYESEYNLNTKPLQIDLLIVKKKKEIEIKNEIGKLFRTHNIMEYKSPKDAMNVSTFLKVVAYACLYKTYEEHVDDIKLDDITITLVRETKPEKLFQWFEKRYGDSVLQVAMKENNKIFRKLKEDGKMCDALRELFEPELKEALEENTKQNRNI